MKYEILQGDNRDTLKTIPDNSIDAIITDPPYGIDFLGKAWDANTGALDTYRECLRVLKPGGHILAFSAARTYHHLAITLEQAGFEIRDQIMWIYSSGFPKSMDVGRQIQKSLGVKEKATVKGGARPSDKQTGGRAKHKVEAKQEYTKVVCSDPQAQQWSGWGTALKPAHEPIALARKPVAGSIKDNVQTWGVGAINIDATRIGDEILEYISDTEKAMYNGNGYKYSDNADKAYNKIPTTVQGRFPSNVIGSIPDYQKYFYCPKVSRRERSIGCDDLPQQYIQTTTGSQGGSNGTWYCGDCGKQIIKHVDHTKCDNTKDKIWRASAPQGNNHPTVKPIELMKYLIKLITPPGGTVLDPFNGSGSTGCAAVELGSHYIGCELDPAYVEISRRRIEAWIRQDPIAASGLFE
jgi:site-specific DNA-methyltransferase (adenine-specific)